MGEAVSKIKGGGTQKRILVLGLDAAGKSTILYTLGEVEYVTQTICLSVEGVMCGDVMVNAWDLGGNRRPKELKLPFYRDAIGLIYVVDSTDRERLIDSCEELLSVLEEDELLGKRLLVLANKQDRTDAMSVEEIREKMKLQSVRGRNWRLEGCSATRGEGVKEGIEWILQRR